MKVERINYRRNFLIDPQTLEHKHIGIEILVEKGDNIDEVYKFAEKTIEGWKGKVTGEIQVKQPEGWRTDEISKIKNHLSTIPYQEDAVNFLKIGGLTYIKELNEIANKKPLKSKI
jgi:hypothetical protein